MRSHFSWLPQAFDEEIFNLLSKKDSFASIKIDLVINGFSANEVKSHFHIYDNSIVTFGTRGVYLGFSRRLMLTV